MKDYYQTTPLSADQKTEYKSKASTQSQIIFDFMDKQRGVAYTASELLKLLFPSNVPITSVRRSLSNLYSSQSITKNEDTRMGLYGRPERTWQVDK